jgi:hypothetical protein
MCSLKRLTEEGEGTSVASTRGFHLIKLITPQVVEERMSVLTVWGVWRREYYDPSFQF